MCECGFKRGKGKLRKNPKKPEQKKYGGEKKGVKKKTDDERSKPWINNVTKQKKNTFVKKHVKSKTKKKTLAKNSGANKKISKKFRHKSKQKKIWHIIDFGCASERERERERKHRNREKEAL